MLDMEDEIPADITAGLEKKNEQIRNGETHPKYYALPTVIAEITKSFTYHAPTGDQPQRYNNLREHARVLAVLIASNCPPSRERSLAITKLEEAIMWANKAIAHE